MNLSLEKAGRLLEAIMLHGPLGLQDLARHTGMHRSSAFRMLSTMQKLKWVEQDPHKRYRLGLGTIILGQAALNQRSVVAAAKPHMARLVDRVQESVSLILYHDTEAYYVQSVEASRSMRVGPQRPGSKIPLHCSGSGKVLLASLDDSDLRRVLSELSYERRTESTITDPDKLAADIQRARERGYAMDNQELETGLICIAAPIRDHMRRVLGSISMSGHCLRMEGYGLEKVAAEIMEAALAISIDMGLDVPEPAPAETVAASAAAAASTNPKGVWQCP